MNATEFNLRPVFIYKKNHIDANLTINELQQMARNRQDSQSFALNLRMQTFAANILGKIF